MDLITKIMEMENRTTFNIILNYDELQHIIKLLKEEEENEKEAHTLAHRQGKCSCLVTDD